MTFPMRASKHSLIVRNIPRTFRMAFSAWPLLWLSYLALCSSPTPSHSTLRTLRASRTRLTSATSLSLFTMTLVCDSHEIACTTLDVEYLSSSTPLLGTVNANTALVVEHLMIRHLINSPAATASLSRPCPCSSSVYPSSLSSPLLANRDFVM